MQNTPASLEEIERLLSRVPRLSALQRCHLRAHIAIENDRGEGIQNNNIGNLSVSSSQTDGPIPFWRPPWFRVDESSSERMQALHELMLQGKEPSAFRAFGSLEEGLRAYVERLRERFPTMLQARSARGFVTQWKASGYTPRLNVEATLRNFEQLARCSGSSSSGWILWAALGTGVAYLVWKQHART